MTVPTNRRPWLPDLEVQQVLGVDDVPKSFAGFPNSPGFVAGSPTQHVGLTGDDLKPTFASNPVTGKRALGLTAGQPDTHRGLCAGLAYRYTKVIRK